MSKNLKNADQFIEWLKKQRVFRQFKDAVAKNLTGYEPDIFLAVKNKEKQELMNDVFQIFLWADTEEGYQFWSEYDMEWNSFYYGRNGHGS